MVVLSFSIKKHVLQSCLEWCLSAAFDCRQHFLIVAYRNIFI